MFLCLVTKIQIVFNTGNKEKRDEQTAHPFVFVYNYNSDTIRFVSLAITSSSSVDTTSIFTLEISVLIL